MEYSIILGICILTIIVVKFAFNVQIKDIKKIKEIGYDKSLNEITNQFPENKEVCETILKQLGNDTVMIETSDDKNNQLSYYSILTNHIIIADIKDTFTRIQTIAHECTHSVQNKTTLIFNFVFSNIYLLYFGVICLLTVFKIIKEPILWTVILIVFSFIYYAIRSYLETDAMTKAPYVAKQYMTNSNQISNEEMDKVMKHYTELNQIGIPMTNFQLMMSVMIKIIIYCIIVVIMS